MTITISTDRVVAVTSTVCWLTKEVAIAKMETTKENHQNRKYERKIRKSQKKLAKTNPSYVKS